MEKKLEQLKKLRNEGHSIEEMIEELVALDITLEDLEEIYDMVAR